MVRLYILLGTVFGFVLSRSGASDYNYIQRMFLFQDFHMYGLIGSAIAVTAPVFWLLRSRGRTGRTASGRSLRNDIRPHHRGHVAM